jgi:hypothetical protein
LCQALFAFFSKLLKIFIFSAKVLPMANKERMSFHLDKTIREALEKEAQEKDRSIGYLINAYLRQCLEKDGRIPLKLNEQ